jgi:hypothetical protein
MVGIIKLLIHIPYLIIRAMPVCNAVPCLAMRMEIGFFPFLPVKILKGVVDAVAGKWPGRTETESRAKKIL